MPESHEDVVIVGAGPIGLACAISAKRRGLDPLVIDAGPIANSIVHYPVGMVFFTTPDRLEIGGHPPALQIAYQVMLLGTLIETGSGMIHAVNERLAAAFVAQGRAMPGWLRAGAAVAFLLAAVVTSQLGLIALIARGYGTLTWLFLVVFVAPILTIGVWRIRSAGRRS
jgi:uncharacterized membrane protein YkvI